MLLTLSFGASGCKNEKSESPSTPNIYSAENKANHTETHVKLCSAVSSPIYDPIKERRYHISELKQFSRVNSVKLKFGGQIFPSGDDYNNDGIEDFYLTVPSYSYSSSSEDWTDFFIVPGILLDSETSMPNFQRKALKRILFIDLFKDTLAHRDISTLDIDGEYIITAKVTPVSFNNAIFLKVEAQLGEGPNAGYISAYTNEADWTTFAKINNYMEIQPIC